MARLNVSSGSTWEGIAGYSRAVRVGRHVFVAGTVATPLVPPDDGEAAPGAAVRSVVGEGDAYVQARHILVKIERYLGEAGASRRHVVRTRMYVTDADAQWEDVARAHSEFFGDVMPAATLVQVSRLIGSEYLVEIEVDAVIHDE
jgi:enamine deaminase RidA (YjgF/YER057c/UK114 family)